MSTALSTTKSMHTPGPWKQQCFLVTSETGDWVCHTGMGNLPPSRSTESEANARLIAAAPNLLKALRDIIELTVLKGHTLAAAQIIADEALSRSQTGGGQP